MKKFVNWKILAGTVMVLLSVLFYVVHYLIFRDAHHIFLYLVGDIAFVFIEVLMVTLIIHQLLNEWEKKSHLKKLNMVIEVFFSEYGKHFLTAVAGHDRNLETIRKYMTDPSGRCVLDFKAADRAVRSYRSDIDIDNIDLEGLACFLKEKRSFLVSLLQNPNLLEHQLFTEMLMALFHISEELVSRERSNLSSGDRDHVKTDIERAYYSMMRQWLSYMEHTFEHFPYFFVFAMETNPFNGPVS